MIKRIIDNIRKRLYGRIFVCPVCHFKMTQADIEKGGFVVCPVCGAVLQVVESAGFIFTVVVDMETYRHQLRMRLHPVSASFPLSLVPASILLIFIYLLTGNPLFEQGAYYSLIGGVGTSFLGLGSGLYDWFRRFSKRRYFIIRSKICLSIAFLVIGISCLIWRTLNPGVVIDPHLYRWIYILGVLLLVPIGITLGHLGGNMVYGE